MANKYPFTMNGYVYSKGTKEGFLRMKRMGIPRPVFALQDRMAKALKSYYNELARTLLRDIKEAVEQSRATLDAKEPPKKNDDETLKDLLDYFEKMKKEAEDLNKKVANQANMAAAENTLKYKWSEGDSVDQAKTERTRERIASMLDKEQDEYLYRLFNDAGDHMRQVLTTFGIDKQKLFNDNMEALKALYLDNSINRLTYEQEDIKRRMLERINDYVTGKSPTLKFDDLTKIAYKWGDHLARLFARDQMQRFNKALTLSTFTSAGVTKIKWVTCHDARVRDTHKALDGKIFNIHDLPEEIDDYNCRCGLVPVEWED
ncbi:MAG: minor capsid protein [Acidaminococcaceae bacterium]|nr:minor capsid protein [Acidaminococcaceae bacterium]